MRQNLFLRNRMMERLHEVNLILPPVDPQLFMLVELELDLEV